MLSCLIAPPLINRSGRRLDFIFGNQAAVTMGIGSQLSACKFALFPRHSAAHRAADGEGLFHAEFLFHPEYNAREQFTRMVNFEQAASFLRPSGGDERIKPVLPALDPLR